MTASLDKFYTIPSVAVKCLGIVGQKYKWTDWDLIVEPSAGNGSFLLKIPSDKTIGIDIEPEHEDIIKQDFLTYTPTVSGKILVVGNPPFGRVSSLAIKFFNHAAKWSDVIAFIVPRTFRRISVQNKLDLNFHLIHDEELPVEPCCFTPRMMAKCCFQIWERSNQKRSTVELSTIHPDWDFLAFGPKDSNGQPTPPISPCADFAIRAYGSKCGEIVCTGLEKLRPKSWHWIKVREQTARADGNAAMQIDKETLIQRFKSLDYKISKDTARQNSIGRGELVKLYSDIYDI